MKPNLLELFYQRAQAQKSATKLLDKAALAHRALTTQEQLDFETHISAIADLDKQIAERSALTA